jgi:pimeloyl-ACP methyl ester carboxylesterase
MATIKLTFPNEKGIELSARLDLPEGEVKAYAIFAHGFASSKESLATSRISRALTHECIAVLRFDFTGLGMSSGEFADTTFSTNVTDVVYAAKYLREHYQAPKMLIGHSLGGAAVIVAASMIPEIRAVATIGAPSNPSHVSHLFKDHLVDILSSGQSEIHIAGNTLSIKKEFLEDIEQHNLEGILRSFHKALLIFHSPVDMTVSIDHAGILYKAARHPKSFLSLDRADHMLTNPDDAEYVATVLAAWMKRYIF